MAITDVGSNSTAEEFSARNMQILFDAIPLFVCSPPPSYNFFMASKPKGVAALPSPKKFAARLRVMGAAAAPTFGISLRSGASTFDASASIRPERFATFIIPSHSKYEPASESMSSTAEFAPSSM